MIYWESIVIVVFLLLLAIVIGYCVVLWMKWMRRRIRALDIYIKNEKTKNENHG